MKHTLLLFLFGLCSFNLFAQDTLMNCGTVDKPLKSIINYYGYWESQVIPYALDDDLKESTKNAFFRAVDVFQQNTNICFIPHQDEVKKLQVHQTLDGIGWGSPLSITIGSTLRMAVHEIGHAIGLQHEQKRPDRDDYITILTENIDPNFLSQFAKLDVSIDQYDTPYDYASVMHYHSRAFSKNGLKTILAPDGITLGGNTLSPIDIAFINKKYPKKINCDSVMNNRPPYVAFESDFDVTDCESAMITFTNKSIDYKDFQWYFEGGIPTTSKELSPTVTFPSSGRYKATLTVSNDIGTRTHIEKINLRKCNYEESIQPNPTTGRIYVNTGTKTPRVLTIQVFSLSGKLLHEEEYIDPQSIDYLIPLELPTTLINGIYIVNLLAEDYQKSHKIMLSR